MFSLTRKINSIFLTMRTCPVAAENTEDNALLKSDFLSFHGIWLHFISEVNESKINCIKFLQDFVYL